MSSKPEDAAILLKRALLGKQIVAFGEDGFGEYGRSEYPRTFTIADVALDFDTATYGVSLILNIGEVSMLGRIETDQNALISIRELLKAEVIDPTAVNWYENFDYKANFIRDDIILLDLDLKKLEL
jgi:hypothetical protein